MAVRYIVYTLNHVAESWESFRKGGNPIIDRRYFDNKDEAITYAREQDANKTDDAWKVEITEWHCPDPWQGKGKPPIADPVYVGEVPYK